MECPSCLFNLDVPEDAVTGELFECPDCGLELELTDEKTLIPTTLNEGEDWGE